MSHFPKSQSKARSPRVRVPNEEPIRFNLDGRLVSAILHKISLTGGLAEFPSALVAPNGVWNQVGNVIDGPEEPPRSPASSGDRGVLGRRIAAKHRSNEA